METLIKEVIFHYRQYSSSVLYYVGTTSVVAGIGGTVGGGSDDDVATIGVAAIYTFVTRLLWSKQYSIQ